MASPLLTFAAQNAQNAQYHWGRAEEDGAPFMGAPVSLTDDEADEKLARVCDIDVRFFDLDDPDGIAAYREVLRGCANNWYVVLHIERLLGKKNAEGVEKNMVYVEWAVPHMEKVKP